MTRIVFFGTPEQAVPTLEILAGAHDVGLVVTQPDRPRGRSGTPQAPPVKETARRLGIPVAQPGTRAELLKLGPKDFDLGIVVAYGRLLPPEVFDRPRYGSLNVHFSLLPRWRGAAPVARALMAGDEITGVTIIRLDEGLDTGPVLTAQAVDILPEEDTGGLTSRLADLGARLIARVIPAYLDGSVEPIPQVDEGMTLALKLGPDDRRLDDDSDVETFIGRVRGLAPSPGAVLTIDGEPTKILRARRGGQTPDPGFWHAPQGRPVVSVGGEGVTLLELQSPGRRPQPAEDWVRGRHRVSGVVGTPNRIE
jgi:methionyl-tRNA formyltransferase